MYGFNVHWDDSQTIPQMIAGINAMGGGNGPLQQPVLIRATDEGNEASVQFLQNLATQIKGKGITLYCCVNVSMTDATGAFYPSEAAAFLVGYQRGVKIATALVPLGVTLFEIGNELDAKNNIRTYAGEQGGVPEDFQNVNFPSVRGVVLGCMAGIRAVAGSSVRCGSPAMTAASVAFLDMLLGGTQPDGSSGHARMVPDFIAVHSYQSWNDPFNISLDYQKPLTNLFHYIKGRTDGLKPGGLPVYISEWNGDPSGNDQGRTAWASQFLPEVVGWASLFNIKAAIVYQLFCGTPWGVLNPDGSVVQNFGQTVKNYMAAHPWA